MQELISRFGGTPALILKLVFLGVINGAAIWAIPALLSTQNWVMLAILILATAALDFFMLGKRFIPGKYVIIGAILLLVFQLIPIGYTVGIAFTNYSTGHIGTKEEAIVAIQRDSVAETEGAVTYDMLPLYDEGQNVVLALTEVPLEPVEEIPTEEGGDLGETTDDVQTEFGGGETGTAARSRRPPAPRPAFRRSSVPARCRPTSPRRTRRSRTT